MVNCRECGCDKWTVVSHQGPLERWRCNACGWEADVHVYDPKMIPNIPEGGKEVFMVHAIWHSTPSLDDVKNFQSIFSQLKNKPISDIIKMIRLRQRIEIGIFDNSELEPLVSKLNSLGVELIKTRD